MQPPEIVVVGFKGVGKSLIIESIFGHAFLKLQVHFPLYFRIEYLRQQKDQLLSTLFRIWIVQSQE